MLLRRFYEEGLAQASYLLGCQATGEALVVDPNRDVAAYLAAAEEEGLRITQVTETHIHADYVSGSRELAAAAGARLLLSAEGGEDWQYAFAASDGATLLRDGDVIRLGNIRIEVLHTPGHTPEHLTFLVTDGAASDRPMGAFTGDFVFVGDVGRPDLLERAAGVAGTMEAGARQLYRSLERFRTLPDYLQLWPGHGAGSACGKALGAVPQTTLGYEKLVNWAFRAADEEAFVQAVLAGQPEPPRYFAEMKRINRDGPPILGVIATPPRLDPATLQAELAAGAVVVDVRSQRSFTAEHVPGTIGIPLGRSFATWAGWLVPYDRLFYIVAEPAAVGPAARALALIGLDRLAGWFDAEEALAAWRAAGRGTARIDEISPAETWARMRRGEVSVVDVRGQAEWEEARLPGVAHLPLGYLAERAAELPRGRPVVLQCRSGNRSAIGASLLQRLGRDRVLNLRGGIEAWRAEGLPVERGRDEPSALAGD